MGDIEEVNLEEFSSWFDTKLWDALVFELSALSKLQANLVAKACSLQIGCDELKYENLSYSCGYNNYM